MKLIDLEPAFVCHGGEGVSDAAGNPIPLREGIGISFKCPCGKKHDEYDRVFVAFANPLDGGPPVHPTGPKWQRTGDTFETMTLSPSIQRIIPSCGWHGYIRDGQIVHC